MSLNIKNERVHELARRAAELTGKTKTGVIEEALERLLESYGTNPADLRLARKIDAVHGLVAAYVADPGRPDPEISSVDDLFDSASGMPR